MKVIAFEFDLQVASIIFLDSPAGTGFSYAMASEAYDSNDDLQSEQIYEFLRKVS